MLPAMKTARLNNAMAHESPEIRAVILRGARNRGSLALAHPLVIRSFTRSIPLPPGYCPPAGSLPFRRS